MIIDKSYFNKQNSLYIPLATEAPIPSAVTSTPNNGVYIDNLCNEVEKSILLNALGLEAYNELKLAIQDDYIGLEDAKYKKLVKGDEYDGKVWNGLNYELGLLANAIWIEYVTRKQTDLSAVGVSQVNVEKGNLVTPMYKIANASASFIKQYQGSALIEPIVIGNFTDWYGCDDEVEVSLYRYLYDKQTDFTNVDMSKFRLYEQLNSFGI